MNAIRFNIRSSGAPRALLACEPLAESRFARYIGQGPLSSSRSLMASSIRVKRRVRGEMKKERREERDGSCTRGYGTCSRRMRRAAGSRAKRNSLRIRTGVLGDEHSRGGLERVGPQIVQRGETQPVTIQVSADHAC